MRFRSTSKTPSYMGRSFQLRMIMMVISLGMVILAIKITSQPSFWAKMFPDQPAAQSEKPDTSRKKEVRSQPGLEGIPHVQLDEVLIAQSENENEAESPEASAEPQSETEVEKPDVESSLPKMAEEPRVAGLKINPERFESIEDYSVNVLPEESDSFFYTIYHASQVPLKELEQAGEDDAAHAAMRADPEYYRGKVITIEGDLRRLEEIPAIQNAYGIEKFFDAWIITPTSDNIPYRVVAEFKDDGLPVQHMISETVPVRVSGYFFKIQAYPVKGGKPQMTPLLIARSITKAPPRPAPISLSKDSNPGRWLFVIFSVVFVVAIWSVYRSTVGSSRMRSHRKEVLESDGDLSQLQGQESIDPGNELRKLGEDEEADSE